MHDAKKNSTVADMNGPTLTQMSIKVSLLQQVDQLTKTH